MSAVLVKACLNGMRTAAEHPAVPVGPAELAREAAAAVAAGAGALHVHPRAGDGAQSLDPGACAAAVVALRAALPTVPVGVTTAAVVCPEPLRRRSVAAWHVLPDFASVNLGEDGAVELAELLLDRGVAVEAGLSSVADVEALLASGLAPRCLRALVETMAPEPERAVAEAGAIASALDEGAPGLRQLHHGLGAATWGVLDVALAAGRDVRIGLEDVLALPDGRPAGGNAELVEAAVVLARSHGRRVLAAG